MKLNIQKFQGGGQSYYMSTDLWASTGGGAGLGGSEGGDGGDDDIKVLNNEILNAISKSGMTAETAIFEQKYANLMYKVQNKLDFTADLAEIRTLMSTILSNSKQLDNAETRATNNKSLDDIAITSRGQMFVMNENGQVEKVHFKSFNQKKHAALTYGDLASLRRTRPELIDDQEAIISIGNSVGTETINTYIEQVLKMIGTSENKTEAIESLSTISNKKATMSEYDYVALRDLATLASTMGLDALFKTTTVAKNKNLEHAWAYLDKMLPRNMEMQLIGNFIGNGGTYKEALKEKGKVIETALLMGNNSTFEYDYTNYQKDLNEVAGTTAGKKTQSGTKEFGLNVVESWIMGLRQTEFDLGDDQAGNQYAMTVKGSELSQLTDFSNRTINNLPLNVALENTIGPLLDRNIVYIGDKRVQEASLYNIFYTYDKVGKVTMPIDSKGQINWIGFRGASKAEEYIKEHGITDIAEKNKVHADFESYQKYDAEGNLVIANPSATGNFMVTHGYTIDDWAEIEGNSIFRELDDELTESLRGTMAAGYDRTSKKLGTAASISGYKSRKSLYKVPIFIKMDDHATLNALTYSNHGARVPQRSLEDDMFTEQINDPVTQQNFIDARGELMWE